MVAARVSTETAVPASLDRGATQRGTFRRGPINLTQYLLEDGQPTDLVLVFQALQTSAKIIASKIARAGLEDLGAVMQTPGSSTDSDRDDQKPLDVVANAVLFEQLSTTGVVSVLASEEEDQAHAIKSGGAGYCVVFDPLDGSSNIAAGIATGTIVGVYRAQPGLTPEQQVLQPGRQLVASAYALYSGATMLVMSTGAGTHGFTLDPAVGEFVLTHPNITVPQRGQYYSLNDARQFDWPAGLTAYVNAIRQGKGQSGKQYSARYICSLVADLHRTLLYGGWCANPRSHLRLVYEANPLAFLTEQAGGASTDGLTRVLDLQPTRLHQRLPLFLGSPLDIAELQSYESQGGIQQVSAKKYEV